MAGCFWMSLFVWVKKVWSAEMPYAGLRDTLGLLLFYFYGLVFGAIPALTGAFSLEAHPGWSEMQDSWPLGCERSASYSCNCDDPWGVWSTHL
jgi:hypothetical protein